MKIGSKQLRTAFLTGLTVALLIRSITGCGESRASDVENIDVARIEDSNVTAEAVPDEIIDLGNTVCPVMGNPVMDGQFVDWNGYRIHFCCAGCDGSFLADPQQYLPVLAEDPETARLLGMDGGCCSSGSDSEMQGPTCPDNNEEKCPYEGGPETGSCH